MADVTLLEATKGMPDGREKAIIMTYASSNHVLQNLPILPAPQGFKKWNIQWVDSNHAGTRPIGTDYTAAVSEKIPMRAETKIYGGKIEIDDYIVATQPEEVPFQKASEITYLARKYMTDFFEGAGGNSMVGLASTIAKNPVVFTSQKVAAGATAGGDLLTMEKLDEAVFEIDVTSSTYMYCNAILLRYLATLQRQAGIGSGQQAINWLPNEFGKIQATYAGIPVEIARDGKGEDILRTAETASAFTGGSAMSAYLVTYGAENCFGMQVQAPKVKVNQDGSSDTIDHLDWFAGCGVRTKRSVVRISNIKNSVS